MGGKRPDQYNIDPAEGSTSDHKRRNEGRSGDEHLATHDKQLERKTETDDIRRAMNTDKHQRGLAGKPSEDEDRDRVDEASEESFPASDPPQQP